MITATQQGRNLHIELEGIDEPFIVKPLPGRMGKHMTEHYIRIAARQLPAEGMEDLLRIAVDGGRWDDSGALVPVPVEEQTNYTRCDDELSTAEAQDILLPALFWQTVTGFDGVGAYVNKGGGMAGGIEALRLLILSLGISPFITSPALDQTTDLTTGTAAPDGPEAGESGIGTPSAPQKKTTNTRSKK